jgi:hypothetical protein
MNCRHALLPMMYLRDDAKHKFWSAKAGVFRVVKEWDSGDEDTDLGRVVSAGAGVLTGWGIPLKSRPNSERLWAAPFLSLFCLPIFGPGLAVGSSGCSRSSRSRRAG